jgi:hypothetical protein
MFRNIKINYTEFYTYFWPSSDQRNQTKLNNKTYQGD